MNAMPSVAQMAHRCLDGHEHALRAIADGRPVIREGAFASEIRGMRTVLSTLRRWECIDDAGLTERGRELLAAFDERRIMNDRAEQNEELAALRHYCEGLVEALEWYAIDDHYRGHDPAVLYDVGCRARAALNGDRS